MINFAAITPHPPIIVPGIGSPEDILLVKKTVQAMEQLRAEVEHANPHTLVVISPHAPIDGYSFGVNESRNIHGSLARFGLDEQLEFHNASEIVEGILYAAEMNNEMPVHTFEAELDHGAMVPLHFLTKNIHPRLVHLSFSFLSLKMHYDFGEVVGNLLNSQSGDVAIVASGDLSHRLTPDAPAGYSEQGEEFDHTLIRLLEHNDIQGLTELKTKFIDEAGECGLRSFVMMLGMIKGRPYKFQKLSYEGPFGVGYLTARML
ncbi:extradiol ring-cleavage dioxygenase [Patescibacteria group bacterium]|nr:MAG: extradiol ring-cleavage dioxygenase [Patescibacteria group bacterium]